MFPTRMFPATMFAPRYWPRQGGGPVVPAPIIDFVIDFKLTRTQAVDFKVTRTFTVDYGETPQ